MSKKLVPLRSFPPWVLQRPQIHQTESVISPSVCNVKQFNLTELWLTLVRLG